MRLEDVFWEASFPESRRTFFVRTTDLWDAHFFHDSAKDARLRPTPTESTLIEMFGVTRSELGVALAVLLARRSVMRYAFGQTRSRCTPRVWYHHLRSTTDSPTPN